MPLHLDNHLIFTIITLLLLSLSTPSTSLRHLTQTSPTSPSTPPSTTTTTTCPLNFTILKDLIHKSNVKPSSSLTTNCQYITEGLRLLLADHLRTTNTSFFPPPSSVTSCWKSYQTLVNTFLPNVNIFNSCMFNTSWLSQGCMNITSRQDFEAIVPKAAIDDVVQSCNQSLANSSPCASCLTSVTAVQASYLNGTSSGGIADCTNLPLIYAGGLGNYLGPSDFGTAKCLYSLDFSKENGGSLRKRVVISVILVVGFVGLVGVFGGYFVILWVKKRKQEEIKRKRRRVGPGSGLGPEPGFSASFGEGSTHLIKYTFEDIKKATKNFYRENLIGRGGYGNVYKATLDDGSEVAIKRFKNCSAAGDAGFTHEVEVIASIRHVNLVELRGYCVATTKWEGHQRIIVCDLMRNGSLHDHIFDDSESRTILSWPIRQKIALGMARGLAYLHYGAQPAVIHRDIKASNILLDENFEAKVGDFGLAKFNPEGFTHMSTRVAGTMGYVAPEYALYGQLTERSDVYSFGVVLLELLSGRKAILSVNDGQTSLLTDWAWSLVRKGHALDVIEEGMPELGQDHVMEKYILIAVLCSHPQLYARPTMDQVVKMLESDLPVPLIPERSIPIIAELEDIERSASNSGSGHLSTVEGFQPYTSLGNNDSPRSVNQ